MLVFLLLLMFKAYQNEISKMKTSARKKKVYKKRFDFKKENQNSKMKKEYTNIDMEKTPPPGVEYSKKRKSSLLEVFVYVTTFLLVILLVGVFIRYSTIFTSYWAQFSELVGLDNAKNGSNETVFITNYLSFVQIRYVSRNISNNEI